MRRSPLDRYRIWHTNRRIENAMRTSAAPRPPEGLRERLVRQAMEAESAAPMRRSRLKLAWAAVPALLLVAGWLLWGNSAPPPKLDQTARVETPQARPDPIVQPRVVKSPPQQPKIVRLAADDYPQRPRHRRNRTAPVIVRRPTDEAPAIRVAVSRSPEKCEGYARVASYGTDEEGKQTRTVWTLVDNPAAGTSREEMSIDGSSGQRQSLRVTVVMPSRT